ncbi:MAG: protein translocase SEC61 complex subunit gamma [archaeon]|jgi:protein translocase SEC61 complex gamma subunit|nr:protein translocase SEC61 complex subunit gamma [Euryarchaeota archaeon]MDP7260566.1 protein translocase SEC61 complex subunit gamma [archaeon]HIK01288.1 protein translocase SEC61 complex subunit gamma [Candidatus Undinarchaeales archaeon ERR594346 U_76725]|tara:strand:- start:3046 stop:3210 length:165 start_codon:yes stop_codon:yes gene_type:complete
MGKLNDKFQQYVRIMRIAKKPGGHEFKTILKVTGLGIFLIGFLGFIIKLIARLF